MSFTTKDISIVIPAYNVRKPVERLLCSLETQQPDPGDFEVIVVDDYSTDGTGEWLDSLSSILNLNIHHNEFNIGRSATRNAGVRLSSRPIVLFLDGDVIAAPGLIAKHAVLHSVKTRAVVGGVKYSPEFGSNGFTKYLETRGVLRSNRNWIMPGRYFLTGHSSVPREIIDKIKGFDETIEYGEDIDFGIRLEQAKIEVLGASSLSVIHQHVRPLEEVAKVTFDFGSKSLPILCSRYEFLLDDLKLRQFETSGFKRMLTSLLFRDIFFQPILKLTSTFSNFRLPSTVYSYILYRSYASGFLQNKSSTKTN